MLYALGVGLGQNPLETAELDYVYEGALRVLPSFAITLCSPGMWIREPQFGVNFNKLVHSAQSTVFHRDLPTDGDMVATPSITGIYDRGEGRGAIVQVERTILDAHSKTEYCTTKQTILLRADGGFGGDAPPNEPRFATPSQAPDQQASFNTSQRAALIYRLSGDRNPLHADPGFAKKAGFDRPILHGLASYAIACRVLAMAADRDLASLTCRFSSVVFPGDTLTFSLWKQDEKLGFIAHVGERKVLDQGFAEFR